MSEFEGFYFNNQLRSYLLQFLAIFAEMQVLVNNKDQDVRKMITVPIKNGSSDRIVAMIKAGYTQNKPVRLPLLAGTMTNIVLAPQLRKAIGQIRTETYMPTGGLFPDDIKVVEIRQPVPYIAKFDLSIWTSNQQHHYQIMEHILMLFDPILPIQTSDDVIDCSRLTTVELVGINFEEVIPQTERRVIKTILNFEVPIFISTPTKVHNHFIRKILMRVGAVNNASITSEDIVADLDAQGITYDEVYDIGDLNIS